MKRRLLKVLLGLRFIRHLSFTLTMRAGSTRVRVPIIKGAGSTYFEHDEPMMDRVYPALLALRPGLFVDVGMNVGQTLIKVKSIARDQPILGFEPNPSCVMMIDELIRLNGYSGVRVVPIALSDRDHLAELQLYRHDPTDGSASMVRGFRPGDVWRVEHIVCLAFGTVEQHIPIDRIGVVKIDVEGAESLVLAGMAARLRKDRPVVVIEILPVWEAKNLERLQRQRTLEGLMREHDYRVLRILLENGDTIRLEPITEIGIHDRIDWSNYILVPAELVEAVHHYVAEGHTGALHAKTA